MADELVKAIEDNTSSNFKSANEAARNLRGRDVYLTKEQVKRVMIAFCKGNNNQFSNSKNTEKATEDCVKWLVQRHLLHICSFIKDDDDDDVKKFFECYRYYICKCFKVLLPMISDYKEKEKEKEELLEQLREKDKLLESLTCKMMGNLDIDDKKDDEKGDLPIPVTDDKVTE